jgi:hypothetical protein
LSPYYYQRLGGWASKIYNVDPNLIADAVDSVNNNRTWVPLQKQPGDTYEYAAEQGLPKGMELDLGVKRA